MFWWRLFSVVLNLDVSVLDFLQAGVENMFLSNRCTFFGIVPCRTYRRQRMQRFLKQQSEKHLFFWGQGSAMLFAVAFFFRLLLWTPDSALSKSGWITRLLDRNQEKDSYRYNPCA